MKTIQSLILAENAYHFVCIERYMEAISRFLLSTDIFYSGKGVLAEFLKVAPMNMDKKYHEVYAGAALWIVLEESGVIGREQGVSVTVYCKVLGTTKNTLLKRTQEIRDKLQNPKLYGVKQLTGWDLNISALATDDYPLFGFIKKDITDRAAMVEEIPKDYGHLMEHYDGYLDEIERDLALENAFKTGQEEEAFDDDFNLFSENEAAGLLTELQSIGDDPYRALEAIEAAVKKLEEVLFQDSKYNALDMWYVQETREYMMLKYQLMVMQRNLGETEKAIEVGKKLMELSPSDGLGVRYDLLPLAIYTRDKLLAQKLIDEVDESTALWMYSKGLYYLLIEDREKAKIVLTEAVEENHFIPMYLEDHTKIPDELPTEYMSGTQEEAYIYCVSALPAWHSVHGAIRFLQQLTQMGKVVHLHHRTKKH